MCNLTSDLCLGMKRRINDINIKDAEHFDSFSNVIFKHQIKYCCFSKMLNNTRLNPGLHEPQLPVRGASRYFLLL